jgi:hypothetical protein
LTKISGGELEISLSKTSSASTFDYVLKRVDATLDGGNVESTAGANVALFTIKEAECLMTDQKLLLTSTSSSGYTGTDVKIMSSNTDPTNVYL